MSNSEQQLLEVLAKLEECRTALIAHGNRETARLVSVAVLDLRMKLNRIGDVEFRALCDEMAPEEAGREGAAKSQAAPRRRPLLKLVK